MAAMFIGLGLASFFLPLISTLPAVMGKTRWSMYSLLRHFNADALLHHAGSFVLSVAIIYSLLVIALLALLVFLSEKLGTVVTYLAWRFVRIDLERMLYRSIQDFRIPRLGILGTGRGVGLTR
jgi:FlaA1/EpsC-like NDP-sugar epimerase